MWSPTHNHQRWEFSPRASMAAYNSSVRAKSVSSITLPSDVEAESLSRVGLNANPIIFCGSVDLEASVVVAWRQSGR